MARKKNNEERAKVIQITSKKEVNSTARNIRKKREELGWEQKDLANKLGVAPTTSAIGRPAIQSLQLKCLLHYQTFSASLSMGFLI